MTAVRHLEYRRLAWGMACGLALAILALACAVFPGWITPPPRPQPVAPSIMFARAGTGIAPGALELRTVRSPVLIALPPGALSAGGATQRVSGISPPVDVPLNWSVGLGMPVADRNGSPVAEAKNLLRRKDISGAGVFTGILKAPTFGGDRDTASRGVRVEYDGGLNGKRIVLDQWSWERWTRSGLPWALSLDIQADEQGRVSQVIIETPADDQSLNEALIENLYRQARIQPAGSCRGRIRLVFAGTP
jgi:hypothetical protein